MGRKRRINTLSEHNIAKRGKGGFTLAEVCIVLAIVAISSAMIVAFSVSMKQFLTSNAEEYEFLEDCAAVEEALYEWIAENNGEGISNDIAFQVSNGELPFGNIKDLHTIDKVSFDINGDGDLIRCDIYRIGSESVDKSYVFALRCQGGAAG